MASALLNLTLDELDQPVIEFTHNPASKDLEQKLLGALIRLAQPDGRLAVKLTKTYGESDEKPLHDYHIRAIRDDD
jgi:hypothetical protein